MTRPDVPRIYLIGYRGSGKSTTGKALARVLEWDFVDADAVLERKAGRSIAEIFRTDGESTFRDLESETLKELSRLPHHVIATGGGVILRASNREILRETGYVIWLNADVETINHRLQIDPSTAERRPNLTVGGKQEIIELLAQREPLYRSTADDVFDSLASPEEVIAAILAKWNGSRK